MPAARALVARAQEAVLEHRGLVAAAIVALVVDGLIAARSLPPRLGVGPDSVDFLRVAHEPLVSGRFWASTRAPVFPLLLRLLGYDLHLVRAAQALISFAVWMLVAIVLSTRMRTTAGRVAMYLAVLLLSATFPVTIWFGVAMSESLSMSLMVALIVVVVAALGRWSRTDVAAVTIIGLLFVFVRDTNALIGLVGTAALVPGVAMRRLPVRVVFVVAVVTIGSLTAMSTASSGGRTMQSLHQVVRDRVLRSPAATAWFEARGLPDVELVRSPAGDDFARNGAIWHDPRFERYRQWLRSKAQVVLVEYLATHPGFVVEGPYSSPATWAGPSPSVTETYAMYVGTAPPLGSALSRLWWPESPWTVYPLELAALGAGVATAVLDRRRRLLATVGVTAIVIGMASVVAAANLATAETPRHAIVPMALARLGVLGALGAGLECVAARVVTAVAQWRQSAAPRGEPAHPPARRRVSGRLPVRSFMTRR